MHTKIFRQRALVGSVKIWYTVCLAVRMRMHLGDVNWGVIKLF